MTEKDEGVPTDPTDAVEPDAVEDLKQVVIQKLKVQLADLKVQFRRLERLHDDRGNVLFQNEKEMQRASVELAGLRAYRRSAPWVLAALVVLTLVGTSGGVLVGARNERRDAQASAHRYLRRETAALKRQYDQNRTRWRSGICRQTCGSLGFRTLSWTTASDVDMGRVRQEEVCRCGTPDGVLFVLDNGNTKLVENTEAKRRNDWQDRRVRELEAMVCATGMVSEEECQMNGHLWRGRPGGLPR